MFLLHLTQGRSLSLKVREVVQMKNQVLVFKFFSGINEVYCRREVAQPGSAPALGAGCRRFKSSLPDQFFRLNFSR